MANRLVIFVFLFCATLLHAQEPSVFNQNFKGVKSVKIFSTETDSAGNFISEKALFEERFFDTLGRETRVLRPNKNTDYQREDFFYDSLGRKTMRIAWTQNGDDKKYIYTYEQNGVFTIVHESLNKEITRTESNYWDSLHTRYTERIWYGESTMGPPVYVHEYNRDGKVLMTSIDGGFVERRYDSLGTLTYMLMRQFKDGQCSMYSPFYYQPVYDHGQLIKFTSDWGVTVFTYNSDGFIVSDNKRRIPSGSTLLFEAEYTFY